MDISHTNVEAAMTQVKHHRLNALIPNPIERTIGKNVMSFDGTWLDSVNGRQAQPFSAHRGKEARLLPLDASPRKLRMSDLSTAA